MAVSRSHSFFQIATRLTGFLRSSHALLGLLAVISVIFFWLSPANTPWIASGSFGLFALLLIVVVSRFAIKGPEADRAQPALSISHLEARILNIEASAMERPDFRALIIEIIKHRQPLPPPAGIISGPASDPASIREIGAEQAEELSRRDSLPPPSQGDTTS